MSEEESKNIIRFLGFSLFAFSALPFLLLRGNLDSFLLTSCLCSLAIYFLKTSIGKLYTYSAISIICIALYSLYLTIERKRNSDPTEIVVTGIIKDGHFSREKNNKNSHAYFKISEYPDLTFISKDYEVMQSFKRYRLDSTKNIQKKKTSSLQYC